MLHTVCKRYMLTQEVSPLVLVLPQAKAVWYSHQGPVPVNGLCQLICSRPKKPFSDPYPPPLFLFNISYCCLSVYITIHLPAFLWIPEVCIMSTHQQPLSNKQTWSLSCYFLNLLLWSISHWATRYQADARSNSCFCWFCQTGFGWRQVVTSRTE